MGLRALAESMLALTLEDSNYFGMTIVLVSPAGVVYSGIYGQVLYDTRAVDENGMQIIVHDPVVTVRKSSLTRVPLATEKGTWAVKIPVSPVSGAATETYLLGRTSEDGNSIGFIRLYLSKLVQS